MTDADLHAVAVYLKDQPARSRSAPAARRRRRHEAGAADLRRRVLGLPCAGRQRRADLFPALAAAGGAADRSDLAAARRAPRHAQRRHREAPTAPAMPAFGWLLDDARPPRSTYIRNTWGNAAPDVTPGEVGKTRKAMTERSD